MRRVTSSVRWSAPRYYIWIRLASRLQQNATEIWVAGLVGRKAPAVAVDFHFELPWLFVWFTLAIGFDGL